MQSLIHQLRQQIDAILLGKEHQVKLALACLLARGHLLLEDLPGMGKTTLAHCLAQTLGLSYKRVQFTSDLLPADILGAAIYERDTSTFKFRPGPIFTQLLLADEINRSSPKTQSALLEAMEEGQVSIEGRTRALPSPFFVIATQNPESQSGTFPLPESQLDRFLMRISLGYPSPQAERQLLEGLDPRALLRNLKPLISLENLAALQTEASQVKASPAVLDYTQRLIAFTREHPEFSYGLSPRGALALIASAKAWALIEGRAYLTPDDIQAVLEPVVRHRVKGSSLQTSPDDLIRLLQQQVDVIH